jgi:hypothetical protein
MPDKLKPMDLQKPDKPDKLPKWAGKLLEAYAECGQVNTACAVADISREQHYWHLRNTPVYRAAFEQTEAEIGQMLEDLAVQRVREGKVVTFQGEPVVVDGEYLRDYDTQLHQTLLKRFKPAAYRERASLEVSGEISISEALSEARNRVITLERNDRTGTEG